MTIHPLPAEGEAVEYADLQDIWVRFEEKWVLKSINLKCFEREILGIVGPNGGGKSTLLKVLMGLIHPDRGMVKLFGRKPDHHARAQIGYLPQISQANRSFPVTALDVVLMGLYNRTGIFHRIARRDKETAMELLTRVNMTDHAKRPFGILSGGQQQRINIARALASKPKLLVLDEPSTGVDSVAQEDFYELLARLRDEQNISVIMVSHDIGVITSHADRIACLNRQIHYHGEPDSCFTDDVRHNVFGKDMKVMVHDPHCITCSKRHEDHD
jgi:zinc transport system ATP-binding protein